MIKVRKIELLAPAKNLECGIEAINHGADAVYIGAPKFSARSAVGNSIEDIKKLTVYAHQFNVKIYVALNTILKDDELSEAEKLIWNLYEIGIDALIIQDMGITLLNLPPIPLHASTQVDNRNIEKIKFLEKSGFKQIVLARELSLDQIKNISEQVSVPLEVFIHGALCVCYSGQCYLSESMFKRSANRGECAQSCRLPYMLVDSDGQIIMEKKHLLSMKDLNLSDHLEELLDAGVSSLKIEGRLKELPYVKNVVAYYRKKLDEIIEKRQEYQKASSGKTDLYFDPNIDKSFNRGYTEYFIKGRANDVCSINTPKSIGEPIGSIKNIFDHFFVLSGTKKLHNGDGLCFFNSKKELQGIRVNRVEGEKIFFVEKNIDLRKGTYIYRNHDHEFEKLLRRKSVERKILVDIILQESDAGFSIIMTDEDGFEVGLDYRQTKELAQKNQIDNIKNNLSKTGNTIFSVEKIEINFSQNWFIPISTISEWRRILTEQLLEKRIQSYQKANASFEQTIHPFPVKDITYLENIMNEKSSLFYNQHQSIVKEIAFEKRSQKNVPLMFTKYCIKYSLGWCPKEKTFSHSYKEPFYLVYNNTKLRLEFNCQDCEMQVIG